MLEALMHAVGDGAVVVERGEYRVHRVEHRVFTANVEIAFLLAGERGIRQIFGGGRGAHRDRHVGAGLLLHARIVGADLRFQIGRKGCASIQPRIRLPAAARVWTSSISKASSSASMRAAKPSCARNAR
jgi:hypothetical protein